MKKSPSITIITPNLNGAIYLEACIDSVLNQGYDNLTYVVIDGGSTDLSISILTKKNIKYEVVKGLNNYEAVNYGFKKYPSDIFGWLSSDDIYHSGALKIIATVFQNFLDIKWLTGVPSISDKFGSIKVNGQSNYPTVSNLSFFLKGNGYLQQESTFWRSELYFKVGGLQSKYKYAADYGLWASFFEYEKLYYVPRVFASFRIHSELQISINKKERYKEEIRRIKKLYKKQVLISQILSPFLFFDLFLIRIPFFHKVYSYTKIREIFLNYTKPVPLNHLIK